MKRFTLLFLLLLATLPASARKIVIHAADYGIMPHATDLTARVGQLFSSLERRLKPEDHCVVKFKKGRYEFHSEAAAVREYYISNHEQELPKRVVFDLQHLHSVTLDGGGADFVFYGTVVPFALGYCTNCTLRRFSIDFAQPRMLPLEIIESSDRGIRFSIPTWVEASVSPDGYFQTHGEGWTYRPSAGMAFEKATHHLAYGAGEFGVNTKGCRKEADDTWFAPNWKNAALKPGHVVAARDWNRPTPAIYINECARTRVEDMRVHYAFGMGLLAQRSEDITLRGFSVCLRDGDKTDRYYTTHADATHFSQCKGRIESTGGLYEGMMDDAINVHGVYLRVDSLIDSHTLLATFAHNQAWGFAWGDAGDSVQFVRSKTMEEFGKNTIASIRPADRTTCVGAKQYVIKLSAPLPEELTAGGNFGIEDLTWTPEVRFAHNVVRNNRARGALFSSPRRTVCEDNLFDHVSGAAILLCGDCNGWYESGSCHNLIIRRNRFRNCLTNYFQFTNALISIYPEIPDLDAQQQFFHSGIVIEDNTFETFDRPLLYAKSVDGITWHRNRVIENNEYAPFHWNKERFLLEKTKNVDLKE
ncbi:MAG: alpha-1,3-galactosidase B [Alloprevotella sp.]|nr:alpha-1,3-galactosidase B [Alloprevotella sp.]